MPSSTPGCGHSGDPTTLDVHVEQLIQGGGPTPRPRPLLTVRGVGYRFQP